MLRWRGKKKRRRVVGGCEFKKRLHWRQCLLFDNEGRRTSLLPQELSSQWCSNANQSRPSILHCHFKDKRTSSLLLNNTGMISRAIQSELIRGNFASKANDDIFLVASRSRDTKTI
jgi:hypothetical protein